MKRAFLTALMIAFSTVTAAQMKGMEKKDMKGEVHKATGVVTNIDRAGGKVTLKHDPVKSQQ